MTCQSAGILRRKTSEEACGAGPMGSGSAASCDWRVGLAPAWGRGSGQCEAAGTWAGLCGLCHLPPGSLDATRPPCPWPWHCSHQPWSCLPWRPRGRSCQEAAPCLPAPVTVPFPSGRVPPPPSVGIGRAGASTSVSLSLAAPPPQPGPAPAPACSGAQLCASLLSFPWVWACCPEHPRPHHGLLPAQSF